jgi:hypothetical protein
MSGDPQFARNLTAILAFTVGVIVCAFAFELVGHGPAEIPAYTARVDYYGAMVSNGADKCPGPLPKGAAFVDVR